MSDTPTNLQDFIAEVKGKGLMKSTHYGVLIHTPMNKTTREPIIKDDVAFQKSMTKYVMLCDSAELPGTSLSTVDVSPYGEIKEQPTQRIYDPINLSFYVDTEFKVKKFFDRWINYIINPITRNHAYYNNYITTVEIYVYDSEHNERYKVTLNECYPKAVGNISMSYAADGIMKLNVTLQYRYYTIWDYAKDSTIENIPDKYNVSNSEFAVPDLATMTTSPAKGIQIAQTIADIKKENIPTSLPVSDIMQSLLSTPAQPILLGLQ